MEALPKRSKSKKISKSKSNPKSKLKLPPLPKDYRKDDRFEILEKMDRSELVFRSEQYNITVGNKSNDQLRKEIFRSMLKRIIIKKDKRIDNVVAINKPRGSQIVVHDTLLGDDYQIIDNNPEPVKNVKVEDLAGTGFGIDSTTPTGKKLQTFVIVSTEREIEED